jgi:DegV family protein with EDD domain
MSKVCILTDSTAQFTMPSFPGRERVTVLPLNIKLNKKNYTDGGNLKVSDLPDTLRNGLQIKVTPPSPATFQQVFKRLARTYDDAIVILLSSHLNPTIHHAQKAISNCSSPIITHVIDSQTTSVGLGLLVQIAAEATQNGMSAIEIKRLINGLIPHIYTIFSVQGLTYLYQNGLLDPAQALVGEMLGITQFLLLDKGHLTPFQKARNIRNLVDIFHEFISEFNHLKHIALLYGVSPSNNELHYLRERIAGDFKTTPYSEHMLTPSVSAILGPRSLGVVAMDE